MVRVVGGHVHERVTNRVVRERRKLDRGSDRERRAGGIVAERRGAFERAQELAVEPGHDPGATAGQPAAALVTIGCAVPSHRLQNQLAQKFMCATISAME